MRKVTASSSENKLQKTAFLCADDLLSEVNRRIDFALCLRSAAIHHEQQERFHHLTGEIDALFNVRKLVKALSQEGVENG